MLCTFGISMPEVIKIAPTTTKNAATRIPSHFKGAAAIFSRVVFC